MNNKEHDVTPLILFLNNGISIPPICHESRSQGRIGLRDVMYLTSQPTKVDSKLT